ncbi:MAG: hypothetical protein HWE20_08840 [Gammaproteobacteria bacterium]|nr:hypothetical protein [Gammaproteobacteria bacterium]
MTTPRELLEYLTENYSAFREPMLLEIGIHTQIKSAVGDVFTEKVIRKVLGKYTNSAAYNSAVVQNLDWDLRRVNLDGSSGSLVSDASKRHHIGKFLRALERKEKKEDVSHYAEWREQAIEWLAEQEAQEP